jgi:hypothetical protein
MHTSYQRRFGPSGLSRWTHLYIVAIALAALAPGAGQPPAREILNSERIAALFGSYGIEVLEQNALVRVSNLFSGAGDDKTCRTFAVVRYPPRLDPAVSAEHAEIVAGGSIGAVFASHGWEVRKTHLRYSEMHATPRLASLMRVAEFKTLAMDIYALDVAKGGQVIDYVTIVEIHHPDYLTSKDLPAIYGPAYESPRSARSAAAYVMAENAITRPP